MMTLESGQLPFLAIDVLEGAVLALLNLNIKNWGQRRSAPLPLLLIQ